MKQRISKKIVKKPVPKVSKAYMRMVEKLMDEHDDVLRELAKR